MKNKRIAVCLKYYKGELNPFDGAALECALETGAKEIVALTMSPLSVSDAFQGLTRLGVKCVMVSDPAYAGSDTVATSSVLNEAIKRIDPDLVFCGRQSIDGDTAQVPPMLAERLGFSFKPKAIAMGGDTITLRNGESFVPDNKTVVSFERIRTLRFPSVFSKLSEIEIWDNNILKIPREKCGLFGSPTRVIRSYESGVGRRNCKFVQKESLSSLIEDGLNRSSFLQTPFSGEKLDEVYYAGNIKNLAESVGENAIELDTENKSAEELARELKEKNSKVVLWEDNDRLKTLSAQTAVLAGAGICADCVSFRSENGKFIMTRPALGGNVTADIVCESDMAFATVKTAKKDGADVVFTIGKGATEHIDKIKRFAEKFKAEVCCSRAAADTGGMPYEKQVGLTGITVCPKVYVAFGVSGAVQHVCAISGSGTVIAVNIDKNANIFDYADFGIVGDINDLEF